mmetsp:Transcript_11371/g.5718  ORF Transcript_11371/g.5718 Transcript_11371/m.5718 type:complete len:104 (+) Transcript_11371:45-356(+)
MFFIIAGLFPKRTKVDKTPRLCPSCGLMRAYLVRDDSYFNFFFIPLFKVKTGEEFLHCERCNSLFAESFYYNNILHADVYKCNICGTFLDPDFKFCPNCGKKR